MTARVTPHARERCAEMGISTKVAKRIAANPTLTRPDPQGNPDRRFVWSAAEPDFAVIHDTTDDSIVTVLFYSPDEPFKRTWEATKARRELWMIEEQK